VLVATTHHNEYANCIIFAMKDAICLKRIHFSPNKGDKLVEHWYLKPFTVFQSGLVYHSLTKKERSNSSIFLFPLLNTPASPPNAMRAE
jgi:hypothetical protein